MPSILYYFIRFATFGHLFFSGCYRWKLTFIFIRNMIHKWWASHISSWFLSGNMIWSNQSGLNWPAETWTVPRQGGFASCSPCLRGYKWWPCNTDPAECNLGMGLWAIWTRLGGNWVPPRKWMAYSLQCSLQCTWLEAPRCLLYTSIPCNIHTHTNLHGFNHLQETHFGVD